MGCEVRDLMGKGSHARGLIYTGLSRSWSILGRPSLGSRSEPFVFFSFYFFIYFLFIYLFNFYLFHLFFGFSLSCIVFRNNRPATQGYPFSAVRCRVPYRPTLSVCLYSASLHAVSLSCIVLSAALFARQLSWALSHLFSLFLLPRSLFPSPKPVRAPPVFLLPPPPLPPLLVVRGPRLHACPLRSRSSYTPRRGRQTIRPQVSRSLIIRNLGSILAHVYNVLHTNTKYKIHRYFWTGRGSSTRQADGGVLLRLGPRITGLAHK